MRSELARREKQRSLGWSTCLNLPTEPNSYCCQSRLMRTGLRALQRQVAVTVVAAAGEPPASSGGSSACKVLLALPAIPSKAAQKSADSWQRAGPGSSTSTFCWLTAVPGKLFTLRPWASCAPAALRTLGLPCASLLGISSVLQKRMQAGRQAQQAHRETGKPWQACAKLSSPRRC